MPQNLQQLKKRIKTSQSIAQITKAMEMIAASKIRKAQNSVEKHNPYAKKISFMVQKILTDRDLLEGIEMFSKERRGKKFIYVISPDKGLCGGLVVNLFKKLNSYASKDDVIVSVGKKAGNYALKYGYNVLASFNMGTSFPKYEDIFPMLELARKYYMSAEASAVSVVYTKFKNMLAQEAVAKEIFPVKQDENFKDNGIDYVMEPGGAQILKDLMPYYLEVEFYGALMNSYASEQASRMTAMGNAKENANEISQSLTNLYNKSRQEKITNEILDLANGQQGI
ncbi:MAG: ATP synthase F1 subunit gamma [Endomicrobia bacterium]|nr:ATP synthase F1 subunit gamma [Endomicrobiia bacterium]